MQNITIRDLRNHGGDVVDRVLSGERLTVTRAGKPVAELRPLPKSGFDAATLLLRWKHLPDVDPAALKDDIDSSMDSAL